MKLNPYLTFTGNCEEAFEFYKSVFGGEFDFIGRFGDMPEESKQGLNEEDMDRVMHVSLKIGDTALMGSDTAGEWGAKSVAGNNFSLSVNADSKDQADALFARLSDGGKVTLPMDDTFWGDYFGMCTDKFQIQWMVSYNDGSNQPG